MFFGERIGIKAKENSSVLRGCKRREEEISGAEKLSVKDFTTGDTIKPEQEILFLCDYFHLLDIVLLL